MKKQVIVEFVSNLDDSKRKWYESRRLLDGETWAKRLQTLIDDYSHRGYRLLRTEQAYVDGAKPQDGMANYGHSTPMGLLLFFESLS